MKKENHTLVSEFTSQGFFSFHEHQLTLFIMFLALYMLTLAGSIIIMTIISLDHHLHIPHVLLPQHAVSFRDHVHTHHYTQDAL